MEVAPIGKIVKNVFIIVVSIVVAYGLFLAFAMVMTLILPTAVPTWFGLGPLVPLFVGVFLWRKTRFVIAGKAITIFYLIFFIFILSISFYNVIYSNIHYHPVFIKP